MVCLVRHLGCQDQDSLSLHHDTGLRHSVQPIQSAQLVLVLSLWLCLPWDNCPIVSRLMEFLVKTQWFQTYLDLCALCLEQMVSPCPRTASLVWVWVVCLGGVFNQPLGFLSTWNSPNTQLSCVWVCANSPEQKWLRRNQQGPFIGNLPKPGRKLTAMAHILQRRQNHEKDFGGKRVDSGPALLRGRDWSKRDQVSYMTN